MVATRNLTGGGPSCSGPGRPRLRPGDPARRVPRRPSVPPPLDPLRDPARLAALRASGLLDTSPEPAFDRLTALASHCTGAPMALLTLVDAERQFIKSAHGLPPRLAGVRETSLAHCLCSPY